MRLLAATLVALLALPAPADEEVGVGLPAPGFSLKVLNPEVVGSTWLALDRYAGEEPEDPGSRVVLLSFFASWCGPCAREMPLLVQLDGMYRERGLRVLAVDIDREPAGIEAARALIAHHGVRYPVLSDRFNFLARRYLGDQAPLPSLFLIDRDGTIGRVERGYTRDAGAFLLGEVQAALGLQPGAAARPSEAARAATPPTAAPVRPASAHP
jgi:thiol-disulfide isomerase/thioredoxin